ncbi:transporter substrate-binding domain-containing protein [Psychromonas ossibalaenae]|uniref:transporter substrate-binding domain-containing protein n=1 Tax=Psychromonas ossibalaenae TaxID=444922 RepID=UPI00038268B5|nr:transporter substrate-binding domain-containing protein [Psychromonas ossibalaenae]
MTRKMKILLYLQIILAVSLAVSALQVNARDLAEIKESGVLRHIGVPYANFVTLYSEGGKKVEGGLDVELMKGFAAHLGLEYQFIAAKWSNVFSLLNGRKIQYINQQVVWGDKQPILGDIIANGVTTLDWRREVVDFADPYFPSAVWLVARADSDLQPITPNGRINEDIQQVKAMIKGRDVLAMKQSCLDPDLYNLELTGANIILPVKARNLNEMVPAILNNDAESTLLDVADTLIALQKWPGEIKVVGPISTEQHMAVAFRKNAPQLRQAFNIYLKQIRADGSYNKMVKKYYPAVFHFYGEFFSTPIEEI